MAWPSMTDLTDPVTGQPAPAAWGDVARAAILELDAAWTPYAASWTGATTNPVLGDGTLSAAYRLIGKTLHLRLYLLVGTTTTLGSGDWRFSLPAGVTAKAGVIQAMHCYLLDPGSTNYAASAHCGPVSGFYDRLIVSHGTANVGAAHPFAWGNGDSLAITGVLEAA